MQLRTGSWTFSREGITGSGVLGMAALVVLVFALWRAPSIIRAAKQPPPLPPNAVTHAEMTNAIEHAAAQWADRHEQYHRRYGK